MIFSHFVQFNVPFFSDITLNIDPVLFVRRHKIYSNTAITKTHYLIGTYILLVIIIYITYDFNIFMIWRIFISGYPYATVATIMG